MPGMRIGYARASTAEQVAGLEAQVRDLAAAGCEKIFSEAVSSVAVRPQMNAALAYVREGDTLTVTKPDRLARSMTDLLKIVAELKSRKVGLRVLSMGLSTLDQDNPTTGLILNILGSVAEFERSIMLERQREGIARAKTEGKFTGRKPIARAKTDHFRSLRSDGMTIAAAAKVAGFSEATAHRILRARHAAPAKATR